MAKHHKKTIMIHCLDTPTTWAFHDNAEAAVREVRRWHQKERGWADIAYAGIIDGKGRWAAGRDLDGDGDTFEETGAGAKGHNLDTIHIALAGGKGGSRSGHFYDNYTVAQEKTLVRQIKAIRAYVGTDIPVIGHHEVDSGKECPCFNVQRWLSTVDASAKDVKKAVITEPTQPATTTADPIAALFAWLRNLFTKGT